MPIMDGWEVSRDRVDKYEKMMETDPVGDPIITSKCRIGKDNGLIVVSNNGFAWRIQTGMSTHYWEMGKSKWVRWHDVDHMLEKKPGVVFAWIKVRDKNGGLKIDKKGNPKLSKWLLVIAKNKDEDKAHFYERRANFYNIMSQIFEQNKGDTDPPTSDSRI